MNSTLDIVNAYRSGGSGASNSKQIADVYNEQIEKLTQQNTALATNRNLSNQEMLDFQRNNQSIGLYSDALKQQNALKDSYQKALDNQSYLAQVSRKYLDTSLNAQGLGATGRAESSNLGIANAYANNIATLQNGLNTGLSNIEYGRINNQNIVDSDYMSKKYDDTVRMRDKYLTAIQNASTPEELDEINNLYGSYSTPESDVAFKNVQKEMNYSKVLEELTKADNSVNNSKEDLMKILDSYKGVISNENYEAIKESIVNADNDRTFTPFYANNGNKFIKIDSYTTESNLKNAFNFNGGYYLKDKVSGLLNGLKNGDIADGTIIMAGSTHNSQGSYSFKNESNNYWIFKDGKLINLDKKKVKTLIKDKGYKKDNINGVTIYKTDKE